MTLKTLRFSLAVVAACAAAAVLASPIALAAPQPNDDPAIAAGIAYLAAIDEKAELRAKVDALIARLLDQIRAQNPKAPPDGLAILQSEIRDQFAAHFDEMIAIEARIYAKHFTAAELDQLTRFYASNVGKKFLSEEPAIAGELNPASTDWAQGMLPQIMDQVRAKLTEKGIAF